MDWLRRAHPEVNAVISATRGNHGQSLAFAAARFGVRAVIVAPEGNSREKNAATQAFGAELIEYGDSFHAADRYANQIASERRLFRVPSFDLSLVKGVATYALEFFGGAPELDTVFVPIGLGSGILGVTAARNALGLKTEIIGVVSEGARTYELSLVAGQVVEDAAKTEIADGLAVSRASEEALDLMRGEVARIVQVSDDEVESAMRAIFADTHNVAEGAGAAAVAAILNERGRWSGKRVGAILSGGNVDSEVFAAILRTGNTE